MDSEERERSDRGEDRFGGTGGSTTIKSGRGYERGSEGRDRKVRSIKREVRVSGTSSSDNEIRGTAVLLLECLMNGCAEVSVIRALVSKKSIVRYRTRSWS